MRLKINILPKGRKLFAIILLIVFMGTGCKKDEIYYDDESIELSNIPGISIYKPKGDYINLISVQITKDGELNALPTILKDKSNVVIDTKGNLKPKCRYLLKNGYIVGCGGISDVFTDITYNEYVEYNDQNGINHWSPELLEPRIIDRDPYLEFYGTGCINCPEIKYTLGQIYEMLEKGTIEEYFTKLK